MTRAVREWAALSEATRGHVAQALDDLGCAELFWALQEDLTEHNRLRAALHEPHWQGYLIPAEQAGPRRPAERCDDCGEECRRPRIPFWDFGAKRTLLLGEGCWRDRMLRRRRGDEVPGDQLQAFPAPMPIRQED